MNGGLPDKYASIEIGRFVFVLKEIGISLTKKETYHIAKLLICVVEEPNCLSILFFDFISPLRSRFCPPALAPYQITSPRSQKDQKLIVVEGAEGEEGDPVPIPGIYLYCLFK